MWFTKKQTPLLQHYLDNISTWCQQNDVPPKPVKYNVMPISFLRQITPQTDFTLNGAQLNVVSHFKLLGITILSDLKRDLHVNDIVSKASHRLYILCVLRNVSNSFIQFQQHLLI